MATRANVLPEINRTDLATKLGRDRGYITNVLNGKRQAHLRLAVSIFQETGVKLGPLLGKTDAEIKALSRAAMILGAAR